MRFTWIHLYIVKSNCWKSEIAPISVSWNSLIKINFLLIYQFVLNPFSMKNWSFKLILLCHVFTSALLCLKNIMRATFMSLWNFLTISCIAYQNDQSHLKNLVTFGSRYSRMDQVKFVETACNKFEVIWSA